MNLLDYLKMYKDGVDFDVPDVNADIAVIVHFDPMSNKKWDYPTPNRDNFTRMLFTLVQIDHLTRGGIPICNFSKIILDNKVDFINYANKHLGSYVKNKIEMDDTELCYQFIKEFNNVVSGYYTELSSGKYLRLISSLYPEV